MFGCFVEFFVLKWSVLPRVRALYVPVQRDLLSGKVHQFIFRISVNL